MHGNRVQRICRPAGEGDILGIDAPPTHALSSLPESSQVGVDGPSNPCEISSEIGTHIAPAATAMAHRNALTLGLGLLAAACSGDTPNEPGPLPTDLEIRAVQVVSGLSQPVHLTSIPGDPRLFVVEQPGRIRIVSDGAVLPAAFLDITERVLAGGERGLLSVAFHPRYSSNGFFYVNYTRVDDGATVIERYRVSSDPNRADPASAKAILTIEQPFANHNGGQVQFGPDGMLYIGTGDGGAGGDPFGHGQNKETLLGGMLRIDVDGGDPYRIPPGNPFVGQPGALPEIWAIGLRNPWRFSFDVEDGRIYIADVGQNRREEVNARGINEAGLNYGWDVMEASLCFEPESGCDQSGLVLPVAEYERAVGCSITGGYVYRGSAIPEVIGHYFYGDYCTGAVRSFRLGATGIAADQRQWPLGSLGSITSFGLDSQRELYIVVHEGRVYRLSK